MEVYQIVKHDKQVYPMGLTRIPNGFHISVEAAAKSCSLLLFQAGEKNGEEPVLCLPFCRENKCGNVWEMTVEMEHLEQYEYAFEADGKRFSDPYGRVFRGREQWGSAESLAALLRTPLVTDEFDWEGDRPLQIPYESCIIYRAHVRGLTKHASSRVSEKGTFRAVEAKIPYLKELGITILELMPVAEFQEVMVRSGVDKNPYGGQEPTGKLNYWGYTAALAMAPKASYSSGSTANKNPVYELKHLVKSLHQAGIELVLEMFFDGSESPAAVLDAVRYWVREYHLDGVHLVGYAPIELLAADPYLANTKLWAQGWEDCPKSGNNRNRAEYQEAFLTDMRRVLKGDEEQMNALIYRNRRNPADYGVINYMAGANSFTMMDMVSYERKHNEANGENNHDGNENNYSWNCGMEGPTRKRKVLELRKKQLRNAFLLLLLSQGTPLILSGDEFGNSQGGNNNAYCQDNEISWLNWNQLKTNQDIYEFVKFAIAFRKAHPVFHMATEPRVMDYLACGHPDISYHGVRTWCPEFEHFRRQIGIMYCGEYGRKADQTPDDYFFVAYNMHWEPHEFALPNLPKQKQWRVAFNTDDKSANGYYEPGQERELADQKQFQVPPRTIIVFIGR